MATALSDQAWTEICDAAKLTPDAETRAVLSEILFKEYPAFASERERVGEEFKRSKRLLKLLDVFAKLYRESWLPHLPVDDFQAILTGHAPWPRLPDDDQAVKTERDLRALQFLRRRTEARLLAARAIRRAHTGRKNVQREWLYHRLCSVWLDNFRGKLAVSVPPLGGRPPYGPLIAFILATIKQVVPKRHMPSPETVRDAIDRERRERERVRREREKREAEMRSGFMGV